MKNFRQIIAWLCLLTVMSAAWSTTSSSTKTVNIPPPANLSYTVTAQYNGLNLNGNSSIQWRPNNNSYTVQTETRIGLLGKILDSTSEGKIGNKGLMPEKYVEKRLRKPSAITMFNRVEHSVSYPSGATAKMKGMEQDRTSVIWQLVSVARSNPEKFVMNSEWTFDVAGRSKTGSWVFKVVKIGELSTPKGRIKTVQLTRTDDGQETSIWLAPADNWYPVRILFVEKNGTRIEQTIKTIMPI